MFSKSALDTPVRDIFCLLFKSDCMLQNKKAAKTLRLHDFTRTS